MPVSTLISRLRTLASRVRGFFSSRRLDSDFQDELSTHLSMLEDENLRRGLPPDEARRQARLRLGAEASLREAHHDLRGLPWLESLLQDVRFGLRMLRKSPGFTAVAILTLALGIGAAVAVFGFVDSALIRPLPYARLSQLVDVSETSPLGGQQLGYSYPNYFDLKRANRVFASLAAYDYRDHAVLTDSRTVRLVDAAAVTANFFRTLGVSPVLGRDFAKDSDREDLQAIPPSAILSYAAWREWFGGKPNALGKTVTLNGQAYTVIGVLPRGFQFAPTGAAFWITVHGFAGDPCHFSRGCTALSVMGRLKDGVTLQQAAADVRAIAARESKLHPDPDRNRSATVVLLTQWILGDIKPVLLALLGGAALLLLIAYINVTGLLLVRSESRRHEFAVRGVLGASRARLIRQFITEGVVIVAISGALGLFAAARTRQLMLELIPAGVLDSMPYLRGALWNWHVILFATAVVLMPCALFALTPALRLRFACLREGFAQSGHVSARTVWRRLGAKLVVLELATTMVLLVGAGLLSKSFYNLLHQNMGFVPTHLATLRMLAPQSNYADRAQPLALQREVVGNLENLPGVVAAGLATGLPVSGVGSTQIGFVGRPALGVNNEVGHRAITAGYLSALQARLLQGRYFNDADANSPPVAIINENLVRRYFARENPVGEQFFYHTHGSDPSDGPQHPVRIVGIVADVKEYALSEPPKPVVYTPLEQSPDSSFSVAVRTSQDAASLLPSVITALHKIDPEIVIANAAIMPQIIQESSAAYWHRASAWVAGGFAALALLLSTVGLYGVIAYSVSQRIPEIGIRMALGAQPQTILRSVVGRAGRLALLGVVLGVLASLALTRLLSSLLYAVTPMDPAVFVAVSVVLLFIALLASYIPARRAMRVDPMVALRHE